jgi:hypothetical protein
MMPPVLVVHIIDEDLPLSLAEMSKMCAKWIIRERVGALSDAKRAIWPLRS